MNPRRRAFLLRRSATPLVMGLCCVLPFVAGCTGQESGGPATVAAFSAPPAPIAVGPIPGIGDSPRHIRNPFGQDVAALQDGRRLFVWFNCAGCHGGHAGGGMAPSLRDERWIYGNADAQIFDSIAAGRANGMPAWGTTLPEQEIWKLVGYIQSLRTPNEPQPPR